MAQDGFYQSAEWQEVRAQVFARDKPICRVCFDKGSPGNPLHVDHIRPRSKYPELSLDLSNLQILCATCNTRKGDREYEGVLCRIGILKSYLEAYENVVLNLQKVHDTQNITLHPPEEFWMPLSFARWEEPELFDATIVVLEKLKHTVEQNLKSFNLEPSEWEAKRVKDIKEEVVSDYPA